jgi:3-oxoadipate CoA-transferase beta subunit
VIDIENGHFVLREKLPSVSIQDLQAVTGAALVVDGPIGELVVPEV